MKKAKKFAVGGMNDTDKEINMLPAYPSDGGGGGAFGGLNTVHQGGKQIGQSLQGIQQNLGGSGQGIGEVPMGMPSKPPPGAGQVFPGYKKGGKVSSASSRADGCAAKGKTKGRMV
jgi:hypothetical protein